MEKIFVGHEWEKGDWQPECCSETILTTGSLVNSAFNLKTIFSLDNTAAGPATALERSWKSPWTFGKILVLS